TPKRGTGGADQLAMHQGKGKRRYPRATVPGGVIVSAVLGGIMFTNAHLQTLWGPQWRRLPTVERRLEKIMLSDGDHCWLHWAQPETPSPAALVVILHGL